ncbi:hypothetical protein EUGRSUZ_L01796 [Eucalyptus grandis]|uniref:Chitin-binding type-1 domain-containing protein n=1 Tax=Eucalyptus grandis TaxID=71139 RepID=A0A058ZS87_EUCGR|nr:hypothetical protein EUGRSUZ_L01796 [Eucalyptus grandis]
MTTLQLNKLLLPAAVLAVIIVSALPDTTSAQHCQCAPNLCCCRWGYSGTGDAYCGIGCQAGPCSTPPPANNMSVADVAAESCKGKGFYSRGTFLEAVGSYPLFGRAESVNDSIREIAAFFGHVTFETGYMCYKNEIDGASMDFCDETATQYACNPNKGIGFNGLNGLNSPETVSTSPRISSKASPWYSMNFVQLVMDQGFRATIRAMNGVLECGGKNPASIQARVQYYTKYCNQLEAAPGDNLTC